jgi:hypothetical protein
MSRFVLEKDYEERKQPAHVGNLKKRQENARRLFRATER